MKKIIPAAIFLYRFLLSAKYVFVNQEKGVWTFSPSCNLGKQGITSMKGKSISVKDNNNFTDISESLQQAFELCQ